MGPADSARAPGTTFVPQEAAQNMKVMQLIHAHQTRGHNVCDLDPLGMYDADLDGSTPPDLEIANYGFTDADLDSEVRLGNSLQSGFLANDRGPVKLGEVVQRLRQVYCGTVGVEYMHIWDHEQVNWIREQIETPQVATFTRAERLRMLDRLCWSDHFESFLAAKWSAEKRFGLEGCEVLIVGMEELIDTSSDLGVENIVMGMPHRGRLNVLTNVVRKPLESVFCEFKKEVIDGKSSSVITDDDFSGSGDVKYHLGLSHTKSTASGKPVHVSLVANPSHLEAVNPVVEGKARAKQHYTGDSERSRTMPILLHGDAAFSGQGVVFETMGLSDLHDYTTGGTVHLVVNNQIGFTTDPRSSRSSPYCTDVAKAIQAPVFHVNGDDVEAVARMCRLAAKWRQRFKRDVVIDIVCYRKHGHNEIDNAFFTQPQMYTAIGKQKPVLKKYTEQLISEGVIDAEEAATLSDKIMTELREKLEASRSYQGKKSEWLSSNWKGLLPPNVAATDMQTGVPKSALRKMGQSLTTLPADLKPHKKVRDIYTLRAKMVQDGNGIDWALAEQLAWASLLVEGNHVRISGQDVERGTFSHRHAVVHDQVDWPRKYSPLTQIDPTQAAFTAVNSSLSEFAVLGFELGCVLDPYVTTMIGCYLSPLLFSY